MSIPPKRFNEEGSHSTPSKQPYEDVATFSSASGKSNQQVDDGLHLTFDRNQGGSLMKIQHLEPCEIGERSSLLHRMSLASTSSMDQQITYDNNLEKTLKDVKHENQEAKADMRLDSMFRDKELKTHMGDLNVEKDKSSATASHSTLNDNKEYHRGKKFYEPSNYSSNLWRVAQDALKKGIDVPKYLPTVKECNSVEAHEAVGDNKIDLKNEKSKDKNRKKVKDFGEDKGNNGRCNKIQMCVSSNNGEILREGRDTEKWEESKNVHEGKKLFDREKKPVEREVSNANVKEIQHPDKEWVNGSVGTEQDNVTQEPRKPKDDRKVKGKKRRRDLEIDGRHELRNKLNKKKSVDGGPKGEEVAEKEKKTFVGIQKQRKMLQTRGTTQTPKQESRSRTQDNHEPQGKQKTSILVYKADKCMEEILKTWKEFEASQDNRNYDSLQHGPTLIIRIPAEYVISTNPQVKYTKLWGTDVYTNDSDLIAVLVHTGYCRPTSSAPPSAIRELRATIRVLPPKECYASSLRNNIFSRAWHAEIGCSYCVEQCCIVKKDGGTIALEPRMLHSSGLEPTLAPVSVERKMTKSAASNALRRQRFFHGVTIQYNLCNEPWLKYELSLVADKGLKKTLYTSARLNKGEVLYLETRSNRYELCYNGRKAVCDGSLSISSIANEKHENHASHVQNGDRPSSERPNIIGAFRWSRCKKAFPEKVMLSFGVPLPVEHLEVLDDNLHWGDVQWSPTGVWVSGKEYPLARACFFTPN